MPISPAKQTVSDVSPSSKFKSNFTFQESTDDSSNENLSESEQTNWKAVITAAVVTFIAAVENTVVGMSEWAYMNEIDKVADAQFFGNATAASKAFHAFAALGFAFWCYRAQSYRTPLIVGRLIAFFACLLYLCVEFVDEGRRYIMLVCYILFGVASSSSSILRAYVAAVSSSHDRPQAYSAITCATMLSIIVGPLIQTVFAGISYPGFELLPNIRFHLYSAPVWVAASTNFISITIIACCLQELPKTIRNNMMKKNQSLLSIEGIKNRIVKASQMNLNWPIVMLCWSMKMITTVSVVTLTTLTSIIFITNYGWTRQHTVLGMSLTMGVVGILSIAVALSYFVCKLGKYIQQRIAFLIGIVIFSIMYFSTYPFEFSSQRVAHYNATQDLGCNPVKYSWCETSYTPEPFFLLAIIALVMGVGIPLALVALDAIYSKCLGNINQSVMQGAMIVAEDIVLILGPIYSSSVYTWYGLGTVWSFNGFIVAIGAVLWILNLKKLEQYS